MALRNRRSTALATSNPRTKSRHRLRRVLLETLEQRQLLAVGPQLISVSADDSENFSLGGSPTSMASANQLGTAPNELLFHFDGDRALDLDTLAAGIRITRSLDGSFDNDVDGDGNIDDLRIQPGFIGFGESQFEVVARFAESLPEDTYRIEIFGFDDAQRNITGLRDAQGDLFEPSDPAADQQSVYFDLQLGAQVISVVPQPVLRDPVSGALTQAKDQVQVYFNSDRLDETTATNPAFYRLIDTTDQSLLFPQSVTYDAAAHVATLTFAGDLSLGTYQLQIGTSEETNETLDSATNLGTVAQQATAATFESPVQEDAEGNPVPQVIPEQGNIISTISVLDSFFIADVNVELDIDHAWGHDLRVFLESPGGQRVELIRDVGSEVLGGQIYGVKFDDLDGDGAQDADEPGLSGWTIYVDENNNNVLDPGEPNTVTDAQGRYAFVGLELNQTYRLGEVPQPRWEQTLPLSGGLEQIFAADFSAGFQQVVRFEGNPEQGTFRLGFEGRVTAPIEFAGPEDVAATAANIETELAAILDPGVVADVTPVSGNVNDFAIAFALNGVGTPVEHPVLQVAENLLNTGALTVVTVSDTEGFTSSGPTDQWHVTSSRGTNAGHTGLDSFYFGAGETVARGGAYVNDADGTLLSPEIDLSGLSGELQLSFNHFLGTEQDFDFAEVRVLAEGNRTVLLRTSESTGGFEAVVLDLSAFAGKKIQLEFNFTSDSSVTGEGWFVDDVQVGVVRGMHAVTLDGTPQQSIAKDINFGSTRGKVVGPDQFGYEAFNVPQEFEDITETGQRVLQRFDGAGFVVGIGGSGSDKVTSMAADSAGNVYVTGSFEGAVDFDPGAGNTTLTSAGGEDVFVAKYSSAGALLWARRAGGASADAGASVQLDAAGNVYLTGSFSSTADFNPGAGTLSLTSAGATDAFLWKLDPQGDLLWARSFGGSAIDAGTDVAVAPNGDIAVSGYFSGRVDFDPGTGQRNLTSAGGTDAFVTRFNSAGDQLWSERTGGPGSDRANSLVIDSLGNITITGAFSNTVDFDPGALPNEMISSGSTDIFVQQLTSSGDFRWAQQFGDSASDRGMALTTDAAGDVFVTGRSGGDVLVARLSSGGALEWMRSYGGSSTDVGEAIAVDSSGDIYVAGSFRSTANFDGSSRESAGGSDLFLLRLTEQGDVNLVRTMGGTLDDSAAGVLLTGSNIHIAGSFRGTSSFVTGPADEELTSRGLNDGFLAKIVLPEGVDDQFVQLDPADLDGFEFDFYGQRYDGLFFNSNGLITFGAGNPSGDNTDLIDAPTQASIAAFWEDLVTGGGERDTAFWEVRGEGDEQRLIVQWNNVRLDNSASKTVGPLNFQAVLRESDGSIQFNYVAVSGPLAERSGADRPVGSFRKGIQTQSDMATDADGNYFIVWTSPAQDGSGSGVYGRRFSAAGVPVGNEFRISTTASGDQSSPAVAMNAAGESVVVWHGMGIGDSDGIFAQRFDDSGAPVGEELLVNAVSAGTQIEPSVAVDETGGFVVAWSGAGEQGDADGVHARRFDASGQPLGVVDEIQRLSFQGPPVSGSSFTLIHRGTETSAIAYSTVNRGASTAANIQAALRALPNTGTDLVVVPVPDVNEVQTITFTGDPTTGTVELEFAGEITAPIDYAGAGEGATTAANIEAALRALPNTGDTLTVVPEGDSDTVFVVTFLGVDGRQDQPLLLLDADTLDQGSVEIVETVQGARNSDTQFEVHFLGADGGRDQPLLVHGDRQGGVTHLDVAEQQKGSSGEFQANTFVAGVQREPQIGIDANGEIVISWTSQGQDGDQGGIFAKRFDAAANPLPGDQDELQRIALVGPPSPGSRFSLRLGSRLTGMIDYAGPNRGSATAANIQTAVRALGPDYTDVTVTAEAGQSDEVQQITFTAPPNQPTAGTFRLGHRGQITGNIAYAGEGDANAATTAGNIEDALRALANTGDTLTVVPAVLPNGDNDDRVFIVTFTGVDGAVDHPPLVLANNQLNQGSLDVATIDEGGKSDVAFRVEFTGSAGRQDHPLLELADNTRGVVDITAQELIRGADSEFQVNQETLQTQYWPSLARRADGSFLIVWHSLGQDGDGAGVFAKLFAANGDVLRDEFQVNTFTESHQSRPAAGVDGDGNFVIAWRSLVQDDSIGGIYARRIGADGYAVGDEFQVHTLTAGDQTDPSVAVAADGSFVIGWTTPAGGGGIHSQRFAADGSSLGEETQVSQFGTRDQASPAIARSANGNYVIVWEDNGRDLDLSVGIYAQVFDANRNAISGEFQVNEMSDLRQTSPSVAIDDDGNFVVAWSSEQPGEDNANVQSVRARRFDSTGTPRGSEFQVNQRSVLSTVWLDVAIDADSGEFTVVWDDATDEAGSVGIMGRRYSAAGNAAGPEFIVNTTMAGDQFSPKVARDPSGNFIVVWSGFSSGTSGMGVQAKTSHGSLTHETIEVFAQRFAANGARLGTEFRVNESTDRVQLPSDIGIDDAGNFVVVWEDWNISTDIEMRRFGADGNPLTGDIQINDITTGGMEFADPRVSVAGDGSFVVVWHDNDNFDVLAQRFSADGLLVGSNFVVHSSSLGEQNSPTVSAAPDGQFLVAWADEARDGIGVFTQQIRTGTSTVGIKDAGAQKVGENVLQVSVGGVRTPLVGPNVSTRIALETDRQDRVFAVDTSADGIQELDSQTGDVINSFPAPQATGNDAGLAFAGGTLYYMAGDGASLYELNPDNGAVVDVVSVAGAAARALAYLEGQLVVHDAAAGELVFVDPMADVTVRRLQPAVALAGALVGSGSRGTLFALDTRSRIVEIDPTDGVVLRTLSTPASGVTGLAVVEGILLVADRTGRLRRVDPDSGAVLSSVAVSANLVALGGDGAGGVKQATGGNYQPFVDTILDDEADLSITEGVGPYTGRFRPAEPLSTFDRTNVRGTWRLQIQDTQAGDGGILHGWKLLFNERQDTPADLGFVGYVGDNMASGMEPADDVDLYRFDVLTAGSITVNLAPVAGLDGVIRLFDAQGVAVATVDAAGLGGGEQLVHETLEAGTFYIGISSRGNVSYSAINGSAAANGTSIGSYGLEIDFSEPLDLDDDNSSFDTAVELGGLGTGGQTIRAEIRNAPLSTVMPGGTDEPGHRHIQPESHYLSAGAAPAVPNRLLLRFEDGVSAARQSAILATHGLQMVRSFNSVGAIAVKTASGSDVIAKVAGLQAMAEVRYAEPDFIFQTQLTPNDPRLAETWAMNNTGQTGGTVGADIDAVQAWDTFTGSAQTVVAVIDTGVDYTHPDLAANMWRNPGEIPGDGIDNDGNGYIDDIYGIDTANGDSDPFDGNGHGTHVSGTIAAEGNNGLGVSGVTWNSRIMALKFLGDSGFGSTVGAIEAIDYMTTMRTAYGVNVVVSNNSWGGGGFSQALQDAISTSIDAGILFVAAAGNAGTDNDALPSYPASYPLDGIVAVSATDHSDQLAGFSQFGATSVDIAAPGVAVLSTIPGGGYDSYNGTSMASPHVSGVAALLAGFNPEATPDQIKQAIMLGADPLPNLTGTSVSGGRLNAAQALNVLGQDVTGSTASSITTAFYNFQDFYGTLPSGDTPGNAITENQKQRAREIFEVYGHYLGIQFAETANQGLTVVTGDMRALDETVPVGPGGVAGLSDGSLSGTVIMDAAENWGDSEYGGSWFQTAMHEIGHSLGLGHSYDLPHSTVQGGFGNGEPVFPGDHDLVHGRFLFPPASIDLDVYRFDVTEPGWITAETVAERLAPNASLLDTALTLYRETSTSSGTSRQVIARNDDYYSNDSYLRLHLEPGVYYVAVSSTGTTGVDPAISNSGFGGTTEGDYELSLSFEAEPGSAILDTDSVALDGDADGVSGGRFDFWFESGPTIFVDKAADSSSGVDGDGSLSSPYDSLPAALEEARATLVMPRDGATLEDGESFQIGDGTADPVRFEFDSNGIVQAGAVAVAFTKTDTAEQLATAVAAAINDLQTRTPIPLASSATAVAGTVRISNASVIDASGSASLLRSPSLVRVLGNGGADGDLATLADNRPYLVGVDNGGRTLVDGAGVQVPQGVTVMIDAGALFKLQEANFDTGSSAQGVDRRSGALQVLGTPAAPVWFRSFRDDSVGGNTDGSGTGPKPGDWGGLVFRADSDMEDAGISLNWVNHASMVHGGGKLLVGSVEETFTPVHLIGSRPTITHNVITRSADAAISADPLSFEDSDGRVGPEIRGNLVVENSINGLFVRIRTRSGEVVDRIELPSRFDDTDIVHVLTTNLFIAATPGGPLVDATSGVVQARLDGRLAIDPGVVVKLEGARIEAQLGAQLIAEGTSGRSVVFTALSDDSFGGVGTFDTKNDQQATAPAPGQWGGVLFNPTSSGSFDHVLVAYAGGVTPIEGGFDRFNAVEIHQGDVRIANSIVRHNAAGAASTDRNGRGSNAAATVFVRGAQPIIVNNMFRENAGAVVNVNANSLNAESRLDVGRETGPVDVFSELAANHGPLVRLNRLQKNGINGMEVRGAVLTTESVWDDTDIAHVLRDEIQVLNHHTFSGLTLQSNESESLVVKISGADAGFTANGTPLDIDDRIGGSIYIVAAPGRPVVLTSLADDSATAGFDGNGRPQGDTNNDGTSSGQPGDWRSVLLDRYSNDRNVEYVREREPAFIGSADQNRIPADAQFLGSLAPDEKSGDETRRLGFEIRGNISLNRPSDVDVYSFAGVAGSEVWFDLDRTGAALDTVLELVDANGVLLARSLDNQPESLSGLAVPLIKAIHLGGDFYTTNSRDAGMRVVLPGSVGETSTYYVRVRSAPAEDRLDDLHGGLSRGAYQLQVRLRQVDEKPGSTIRGADIRYATNAIEVHGLPGHSPLVGETVESTADNNSLGAAQPLGNLLTTDRNTISVGGSLSVSTDVDWYSFTLDYDLIQAISGTNGGAKTFSTIFDIDYADGLGRPDTVISVFDEAGNVVLVSRDSNVEDDQPGAGQGADTDDLSRGSFGTQDAFIGSVQMPAGVVPANLSRTYYVAVSSNSQLPLALNATFAANPSNSLVRLEPVNSVQRIAEDHIGFSGYTSGDASIGGVPVRPTTSLFDISNAVALSTNVVPFTLNDVVLYVGRPGEDGLRTANPFTGRMQTTVGNLPGNNTFARDFTMRSDGRMFMVESIVGPGNAGQNTAGRLVEIDPATGAQTVIGNDNIPDFDPATNPPDPQQLTSSGSDALAFLRTGFDGGQNRPTYSLYYSVQGARRAVGVDSTSSTLYRANPESGSAAVADGEPWGVRGEIYASKPGDLGRTTGMAFVDGVLYGVSDTGKFYQIDLGTGRASAVVSVGGSFSGLATGPQNLEGGRFADMLFATTSGGQLVALDTSGARQPVFAGGATSVNTGFAATGLAFSLLDFNLWHPTERRGKDAGHGINAAFDQSRNPDSFERFINGRDTDEGEGGASFHFGFEQWESNPTDAFAYFTYGPNAQYGMQTTDYHRDLSTNPRIGNNYDLPGGALGSLATRSLSLSGYTEADKPTLYFNYFLETENANAAVGRDMRDSARVLVSADGGNSWQLLATNNSVLSTAGTLAELPRFISPSSNASEHPRQRVQELFDNTGGWRQARVDLSDFAGRSDLTFRFDFSTAGSMNQGAAGDAYGDFTDRERGLNNNFEGFYVDDVIVGFAERGEMVTGSTSLSQFMTVPQDPDPGAPSQALVGDYQLELRRGTEYGETLTNVGSQIGIFQTFDTNSRMIGELRRLGDRNLYRDQGQLRIVGNTITDAAEFGIVVDAGLRDTTGDAPHPGGVRNLPTVNNQRLVSGVHIENNVVASFGDGGILFSGDPNIGNQPVAAVPFGRIINNTIYGGVTPLGTAIRVTENASPTILNNIIANTADGVSIDGTSSTSVVGANLFQGNTDNGTVGSNALLVAADAELFVNATNGNFYLAPGSDAIDSSLDSLPDRPGFVAVKSPLGMPISPILAPDRDRFGQLRLDDPSQDPPPGLGSNIFKDRGAIERADFVGPVAHLINPLDNDGRGWDLDPLANTVLVDDLTLPQIVIQLRDTGIGIDDTSVRSANVSVTLDGVPLQAGRDYQFTYDRTNQLIVLAALANSGPLRSRYVVTLNNAVGSGIRDSATNALAPNGASGETVFTIVTGGINVAPVAVDDLVMGVEDTALQIDVANNDSDPRGVLDLTSIVITDGPGSGSVTVNADGTVLYLPALDFFGTDSFTYTIRDTEGLESNEATVTVDVEAVINDPPEFTGVPVVDVREDRGPFSLQYATGIRPGPEGDSDEVDQTVTFIVTPDASNPAGLIPTLPTISENGTLRFSTATDAVGTARFIVTLVDDGGAGKPVDRDTSDPQTLTINVRPVNDPPVVIATERARYTLLEDNLGSEGGFFIPLRSAGASSPDGLLDPFTVGPANEADSAAAGGNQTLSVVAFARTQTAHGSVESVTDADGKVTGLLYRPDPDFNSAPSGSRLDTIFYTVTDDGLTFSPTTGALEPDPRTGQFALDLVVEPVNDAPSFTAALTSVTRLEDSGANQLVDFATEIFAGPLTAGDENDASTGQNVSFELAPAPGFTAADIAALFAVAPAVSSTGTLTFTPASDAVGTVELLVFAVDDGPSDAADGHDNRSAPITLTMTIAPVNDPPVASPATIFHELDEDRSLDLAITRTDGTGLLDGFRVGPDNEADGTPGGNQSLRDNVVFASATAGGGQLEAFTVGGQFAGIRYTPAPDFSGSDSFVYKVADNGRSFNLDSGQWVNDFRDAWGTVSLTVHPVNDRPEFAGAADVSVVEDTGSDDRSVPADQIGRTTIDDWVTAVLAGPATAVDENSGADAQDVAFEFSYISGTDPSTLFAELPTVDAATGQLRFRTAPDAHGQTTFQIAAVDDGPRGFSGDDPTRPENQFRSLVQNITINITAVNDAPTITPGGQITVAEDSGPFSALWATDVSPGPGDEVADGQGVLFDVVVADVDQDKFATQPTLSSDGVLQFTPAEDVSGEIEVLVTVRDTDGGAASNPYPLTISITPVNDAPVANDDVLQSDENTVVTIAAAELLSNDSDVDLPDDQLALANVAVTSQLGATVTVSADGSSIVYDPTGAESLQSLQSDETAADVFTYHVVDLDGETSSLATVTLTITGSNDAPVAGPDRIVVHPTETSTFSPLANDTDVDGTIDPSSVIITLQPLSGSLQVDADGTFTYTPRASLGASDRIHYRVRDDLGQLSEPVEIRLIANAPPVARADVALTYRNEPIDIAVLGNDSDANGTIDSETMEIVSGPQHGVLVIGADRTITYTPAANFFGKDSFSYRVFDDQGAPSNLATADIRVLASRMQNPGNPLDVNVSSEVSPIDALLIVNYLNRQSAGGTELKTGYFYDVDGNGRIAPLDALLVINALNRSTTVSGMNSSGEGESVAAIDSHDRFANPGSGGQPGRSATLDDVPVAIDEQAEHAASLEQVSSVFDQLGRDPLDELLDELTRPQDDSGDKAELALDAVWSELGSRS